MHLIVIVFTLTLVQFGPRYLLLHFSNLLIDGLFPFNLGLSVSLDLGHHPDVLEVGRRREARRVVVVEKPRGHLIAGKEARAEAFGILKRRSRAIRTPESIDKVVLRLYLMGMSIFCDSAQNNFGMTAVYSDHFAMHRL